jgi:peptidoglycan/LPS O-acetylase OafA/YrhL
LAASIIFWHAFVVSYGAEFIFTTPGIVRAVVFLLLPMFFALSGFLVAGSWERSKTLFAFLGLRVLRIAPALSAEVIISALLLGPAFTSLKLSQYFRDPEFHIYFLNIVGDIHFHLPGVFLDNPIPNSVNLQLWTVPYELQCYIALAVLAILGVLTRPAWLLMVIVIAQVVFGYHGFTAYIDPHRVTVGGSLLVLTFLFGVALYIFRNRLPYSHALGIGAILISLVLVYFPPTRYLVGFPASYATVYLGLLNPKRLPLVFSGDYSYGLYLYGFPLQQAVAVFPPLRHWWINFGLAFVAAAVCAVISWWLLEKRVLTLRRFLVSKEKIEAQKVAG